MKHADSVFSLGGAMILLASVLLGGIPLSSAQSQQQINELCEELRRMDAEMAQMDDPQMRQALEKQFAPMRAQCTPGFAAKQAAKTPPAQPAMYGRYRLVAEQHRQINRSLPGGSFNITDVHRTQVEFEVGPNQREFNGKGTIQYVSANGMFTAGGCQGRLSLTPVTHPSNVNARMNSDGHSVFILVDDLHTGGIASSMQATATCPDQKASVFKQMMPEDGIFVKSIPLRHGAQVTEVSEANGIRNTVKATLHKL